MDWDDLRIALEVTRHGSLSAAARSLRTTQPTLSRRLDQLERRIGVKLFERGTGGLKPTQLCTALVDGLQRMEEGAEAVERRIAARDTGLQGHVMVTSLDWLGDYVVAPIVAKFGQCHKLVAIELINDGRLFNLSRREADIAIRFRGFDQDSIVERKLAEVAFGLYASPSYLKRHGQPDFAAGCAGHETTMLHQAAGRVIQDEWLRKIAPEARVIMRASGIASRLSAAEAGLAMVALPRVLGDRRPGLRRIAAPVPCPLVPVRMGFHEDLRDTPRIRAFVDFAVAELQVRSRELNPR